MRYTWGMDLSGTMQGAGGVGGLLAVNDTTANYYPTYDGNGNISEYLDASGAVVAHYEHDAFGRTVVQSGAMANNFSHQFSTKQRDAETGLHYYGYRYYDALNGRWPSRDPIEERGGVNLYTFVGNDGVNAYDVLGLKLGAGKNVNCEEVDQFLEDAMLAKAAYEDNANGAKDENGNDILPEGWKHTGIAQDPKTGLSSSVFEGPNGEKVVAFRGTQDGQDWKTNLKQGAGLYGAQYKQVQAMSINGSVPGATRVVGHSLGGGLAAAYGSSRNLPTTTFNAAGVHSRTTKEFGNKNYNNVNSVVVRGEVLNLGQDAIPLVIPDSKGDRNYLNPTGLKDPVTLHGMEQNSSTIASRVPACQVLEKMHLYELLVT